MAKKYNIETSLTLDYRKWNWGIERILLDAISNHLPDDSKGTKTTITFKQGEQYKDLKTFDPSKPVDEIIFEDDGSGYDAKLLSVLFSTKELGGTSVGQFGEGLKMISAAALREDITLQYQSRNWSASPYTKHEKIDDQSIDRLCFAIEENGTHIKGSRTVIKEPSERVIVELLKIPEKVLLFNDEYRELHNEKDNIDFPKSVFANRYIITPIKFDEFIPDQINDKNKTKYHSRIIDMQKPTHNTDNSTHHPSLFVKGVYIRSISAIFSYDLGIESITPDRAYANEQILLRTIEDLLKRCKNEEVISAVIKKAHKDPRGQDLELRCFAPNYSENIREKKYRRMEYDPYDNPIFHAREYKKNYGELKIKDIVDSIEKKVNTPSNWANVFRKMYGNEAVIASEDTNKNEDAKLMGYNPIKINSDVGKYLKYQGILEVDEFDFKIEYRWMNLEQLTEREASILKIAENLNEVLLGERKNVPVKVYSGLFADNGREIKSSKGIHVWQKDGEKYIGIKRDQLVDEATFAKTYVHELGHYVTDQGDYNRTFTDFFVQAVAKLALEKINK